MCIEPKANRAVAMAVTKVPFLHKVITEIENEMISTKQNSQRAARTAEQPESGKDGAVHTTVLLLTET